MNTTIDIKSPTGQTLLSTPINTGAKGYYSLMQHDYVTLPFSLPEPIDFGLGSYVALRGVFDEALGGKLAKIYYVKNVQTPTYNTSTGGYDYTLRLDAYYWLWANFIFKYTPENAGQEASWSLTAPLDVHLGIYLRNLSALGFTYGTGTAFTFEIDSTVSTEAIALTYSNTNLIDAFSMMAEKLDCEWWVRENVIHFGKCEQGDPVELEIGISAETMTRNESKGTYATRIYAFGSTRNIPTNYRPVSEQAVVSGVVQKRLMLPEGTPYIDAYPGMTRDQVVESVVVFDEVYPRRVGTLSDVKTVDRAVEDDYRFFECLALAVELLTGLAFAVELDVALEVYHYHAAGNFIVGEVQRLELLGVRVLEYGHALYGARVERFQGFGVEAYLPVDDIYRACGLSLQGCLRHGRRLLRVGARYGYR